MNGKIGIVSAVASLISALIAVISCILSNVNSKRSGKSSQEARYYEGRANAIAMGAAEVSLYSQIAKARKEIEDASIEIAKFNNENNSDKTNESNKKFLNILQKRLYSCIENYLNSYEVACDLYLRTKLDGKHFESTYIDDIKNLCEEPAYKRQMQPEDASKYKNIWEVYHKLKKLKG